MDLRITIIDENNDVLRALGIYQDGSDSEGADHIVAAIQREYPNAELVDVDGILSGMPSWSDT